jgi:hypothetical protein
MYGIESARRSAPETISSGRIRWDRSTMGLLGEIPLMTE